MPIVRQPCIASTASRAFLDGMLLPRRRVDSMPSTPSARERARRHRYRNAGLMSYEELKKVLRSAYPGLEVAPEAVTDNDIRGLWRGLDDDLSGEVSVQEFMIFFRRHGREHSMFKPTDHDLASRGLLKGPEKVEKVELPPEKLRSIVLDLKRNLHKYYQRRGMSPKLDEQWRVFFNTVDEDASGRLDFPELKRAVKVLGVQLDDESLRGLFTAADEDSSGEITTDEFQHCVYKLELETWPDLSNKEELLQRAISVLNQHAEKWHRAGGNWYKIFKRIDADDSNTLAFEEFRHMCRSIYPGLNIDRKLLPDGLLRGLWRGIDADSSGNVTVQEFMVFMRAHAAHLDSMAGYTHRMHELASSQKVVEDTVNVEKGTGLRKLALLRDASIKFEVTEEPPVVAEWDFEALVRSMGLSETDLTADDCHAVWRAVAGRGEAYDRDGLLGWCRDPPVLKDGATDDEAPASPGAE